MGWSTIRTLGSQEVCIRPGPREPLGHPTIPDDGLASWREVTQVAEGRSIAEMTPPATLTLTWALRTAAQIALLMPPGRHMGPDRSIRVCCPARFDLILAGQLSCGLAAYVSHLPSAAPIRWFATRQRWYVPGLALLARPSRLARSGTDRNGTIT